MCESEVKLLSHVRLLATPWAAAFQAPSSMGFARQEYWSGVPLPSPVSCSVMSNSVIPWTIAHQAPLSMEFPRQEYWSGLTFPSPRDLPDPGIEPGSLALQAYSLPAEL